MPQIDVKLNSTADLSGVQRMQAGVSRLQQQIEKKWDIPDIGKSLLSGFGFGSAFAAIDSTIGQYFRSIQEKAQAAKEEMQKFTAAVDQVGAALDALGKKRIASFVEGLSPAQRIEESTRELQRINQAIDKYRKERDAAAEKIAEAGRASGVARTILTGLPEKGNLSNSVANVINSAEAEKKQKEWADKQVEIQRNANEKLAALEADRDEQLRIASKAEKEIAAEQVKLDEDLNKSAIAEQQAIDDARQRSIKSGEEVLAARKKENDELDEAINKSAIAEAQSIEEAKAKSAASGAEILETRKKTAETNAAAAAIRAAQDAVEQYDTALARLDANPYLSDQEKQAERLRILNQQTEAIKAQKQALDDFAAKYPGVDVGGLASARDRLSDKATTNATEQYKTANKPTRATRDAIAMRDMGIGSNKDGSPATVDPSQHYQGAKGGAMGGITSWLQQVGTLGDQVAQNLASVFNSAASGISQSIMGLINRTMTWGQALANIGSTIIQGVIQAFANMVAQWIVKQIVMAVAGKAIQAAQVAAAIPVAMAASAIWAVPATLATIATMGAAAAAAPAEIMMANMIVMGTSLAGFAEGGIIPAGMRAIRVNEDGIESVLNANATRNLGSDAINALNSGQPLFPSAASLLTRPGYSPAQAKAQETRESRSERASAAFIDHRDRNGYEQLRRNPRFRGDVAHIMNDKRGMLGLKT